MQFIFSTPVLIKHMWLLKTVVFLHWCIICAALLKWPYLCQLHYCTRLKTGLKLTRHLLGTICHAHSFQLVSYWLMVHHVMLKSSIPKVTKVTTILSLSWAVLEFHLCLWLGGSSLFKFNNIIICNYINN